MDMAQILIVEDESIIALDIRARLRRLGYGVAGVTGDGEEALALAADQRPDLVLMDVYLKGDVDGIQAAEQMRTRFDIPVIYLTAYADHTTMERAKLTSPFGYVLKPFEDRDLQAAIEMGLYKHQAERALREQRDMAVALRALAEKRLAQIEALRAIDMAIGATFDPRPVLGVFLEQITTRLQADAALVFLLNPYTQILEHAAARGFHSFPLERLRLRPGEGLAGQVAASTEPLLIADLRLRASEEARPEALLGGALAASPKSEAGLLQSEGFVSVYAVALLARMHVKGVVEILWRTPFTPDDDWRAFLDLLALEAAAAIDSAQALEQLQRSNDRLALAYNATVEAWARALDLSDKESADHTRRLAELTERVGRAMGLSDAELIHLRRGVLLHDVGHMAIPDPILFKPGPLTESEWAVVRDHPVFAHDVLAPVDYLRPALDIPYCHHERWDGTGYPRGLRGEQIPLAARIFAVVDVWDALTSDRPYRVRWPEEQARDHLRSRAGTHFDPKVVDVFLMMVEGS